MDPRTLIDLSYCPQTLDKNLDTQVLSVLSKLNSSETSKPVFSLNWVLRRITKIAVIVLPPSVTLSEDIPARVRRNLSKGSHTLFARCAENDIPIVFALSKGSLSKLLRGEVEKKEKDWHDLYPVGLTKAGIKEAKLEGEVEKIISNARRLAEDWENGFEDEYYMNCISCGVQHDRADLCCGCLIDETHLYCGDCIVPDDWAKGCPTCTAGKNREFSDEDEADDRQESYSQRRDNKRAKKQRPAKRSREEQPESSEEREFKWKMCRVFVRIGNCPYGKYCQYKHGEEDTREEPAEKPEDWEAPPIEYVKHVHPSVKPIFAALVKEFEARDKSEDREDFPTVPKGSLYFKDCIASLDAKGQLTISGKSLKWTEIAYFKLRDEFVKRLNTTDAGIVSTSNVHVVIAGKEPFRFTGRVKTKLLRLKGSARGAAQESDEDFEAEAGKFSFVSSSTVAETEIGNLLKGCKNDYGELRLGLGFTRFSLEHDHTQIEEPEETAEGEDAEERKPKVRVKDWEQKQLSAWKKGSDFDVSFNPYWLLAQADTFKSVLKNRGFVQQTPEELLEIECLSGKAWKSLWFRWEPKIEAEEEETEEGERKERKPLRGDWIVTDPLGEVSPATEDDVLVYYLNLNNAVDKDAVFIISQRREANKLPAEEALLKLLNPATEPKPSPHSLNSRILDQSSVFIKDFRVVTKQRFVSPDGQFSVEFHSVKRKGIAVNFVWNKPLMKLEKNQIVHVLSLAKEWLYQVKTLGTVEDLRQRNRALTQQLRQLDDHSKQSKGDKGGKRRPGRNKKRGPRQS